MENEDARERLALAVVALQRGDKPEARRLLHALLSEDPTNVAAWYWACQAGDTTVERRYCLKRLLELDPGNEPVRRYLSQLTPAEKGTSLPVSPATPSGEKDAFSFKVTDLFWGPIAFSFQLPPFVLVSLFVFLVSVVVATSYRANTSFFGLSTPDFDNLRISEDCDSLDSAGPCWNVVYESSEETVFVGDVRYIAPMRMWRIPFMTHNILVTSGDFSDPDKVETKVNGEALKWRSIGTPYPEGRINFCMRSRRTKRFTRNCSPFVRVTM